MTKKTDLNTDGSALKKLKNRTGTEKEVLIPLDKIKFDPSQPRKAFHTLDGRIADKDVEYIKELAKSIERHGLIQAITVQEQGDGTYLVLVGECRARAHLLLGEQAIRARVFNEKMSPARRLIYQIAENVDRKDLTDEELAESILFLMEKGNDGKPMKQFEIATALDKSEGWVSRYVRFADKEVHRVWVESGIAPAVEIAYHLSNISKPLQLEILRRVGLPQGDKEHLEIPFTRKMIDQFREQDKAFKAAKKIGTIASAGREANSGEQAGGYVAGNDAIDLALQNALIEGRANQQGRGTSALPVAAGVGGYQLPPEYRAELLGNIPAAVAGAPREPIAAPVNCRVSLANLVGLLDILQAEEGMLESARGVRLEVSIPGPFAKLLANKLVGLIVDDQQLPANLQTELAKLG